MNVLTKVEAEKVLNILRDTTDQLEIISHIPSATTPEYLNDIDPTESIVSALEKLWICEEGLSQIETTSVMFDSKDIALLRNTHKSVRSVCNSVIANNHQRTITLKPIFASEEFLEFLSIFDDLKMQTFNKLNTTVEDEDKSVNTMHELGDKIRLLEETKRILDSKLKELNYQRQRQCQDLDDTKNKLVIELKELSEMNSKDSELVVKEMTEAIQKATEDHELRMKELEEKTKLYEGNVKDLSERDHEDELKYRKDKNRAEAALNAKIDEYNHEMKLRSDQLQELDLHYEMELKDYNGLKTYFDKVDADLALKAYEAKLMKAVQDREDFGRRMLFKAAATIQKIVRGRQARKAFIKMKSKKSKKGKGKGGKKGKK